MTDTSNRKVILTQSRGIIFEREFFLLIQEAILDGFRIAETDLSEDESLRMHQGFGGKAVLYKEGTAPDKWTPESAQAVADAKHAALQPTATIEPAAEDFEVKEEGKELSSAVPENVELTPLQELGPLTKGNQLKEFAVKHNLVIPKGVTNPKAIKKALKAELET